MNVRKILRRSPSLAALAVAAILSGCAGRTEFKKSTGGNVSAAGSTSTGPLTVVKQPDPIVVCQNTKPVVFQFTVSQSATYRWFRRPDEVNPATTNQTGAFNLNCPGLGTAGTYFAVGTAADGSVQNSDQVTLQILPTSDSRCSSKPQCPASAN